MRALILWLLLAGTAHAWSETDQKWAAAAATIMVIDWGQTRYITKNTDRFHETNPVLGRYPEIREVNRFFLANALVLGILADQFPAYRRNILQTYVVLGGLNVAKNFQIGLRLSF